MSLQRFLDVPDLSLSSHSTEQSLVCLSYLLKGNKKGNSHIKKTAPHLYIILKQGTDTISILYTRPYLAALFLKFQFVLLSVMLSSTNSTSGLHFGYAIDDTYIPLYSQY